METLTLVPAYGREYKSKKAVLADWEAGKDFRVVGIAESGYVNKNDDVSKYTFIEFRYKQMRNCFIMKVK